MFRFSFILCCTCFVYGQCTGSKMTALHFHLKRTAASRGQPQIAAGRCAKLTRTQGQFGALMPEHTLAAHSLVDALLVTLRQPREPASELEKGCADLLRQFRQRMREKEGGNGLRASAGLPRSKSLAALPPAPASQPSAKPPVRGYSTVSRKGRAREPMTDFPPPSQPLFVCRTGQRA